ncbi:hypothetical protein XB05_06470 [Xanthomonas arboricola]|uniref:hypothetical protein n=1 Tax=Xanthomonas arboricola TaxID=56448 RepID=UPI00061A400B|nr:hypothetical protein [Xanthomonas arboricola]AKC78407.1 hypothetical protein XB05_06470 [Xanthomonas arboricola]
MTVLEDSFRGLFTLTEDEDAPIVEFQLDSQKYSARFALDRIRQECLDTSRAAIPARVTPRLYIKTAELLQAGVDFKAANQLCSAAHAGTVLFTEGDQTIDIVFDDIHHDRRYAAIELLGHMPLDVIDHSANLYAWARRQELRPPIVGAIARSTRISGQKVFYDYSPHLAVALAEEMMQLPSMVPEGWRFPWGGCYETMLLINAMCVRCMYHWIAVHFGASLHGLRGGGEASLLYITKMQKLVADLDAMCSLGETRIRSFLQYLSHGYATKTPDPALQPIVALTNGLVAVPCLLYLSSNYERNLLGLQARIDSKRFDSMSKLFEVDMVHDLLEMIRPRWPFVKGNQTLRADGGFEEIDLLVADPGSQTVLVCELRWMLQPGDPREVQNRKNACREKVGQLARKVQWLQPRIRLALDVLGVAPAAMAEWRIEGVIVIKTFGGTLSNNPKLPIMTERIFMQGMQNASSLRHFADWSQSLGWLPQEGVHFRIVPQEIHLSGLSKHLVALGMEKLCPMRTYVKFVERSLAGSGV